MPNFLERFFRSPITNNAERRSADSSRSPRLGVEQLETRELLANASLLPDGQLLITGDNRGPGRNDSAVLDQDADTVNLTLDGQYSEYPAHQVRGVTANMLGGNDSVIANNNVTKPISANFGRGRGEVFRGGSGNDVATAIGSGSNLDGGPGADVLTVRSRSTARGGPDRDTDILNAPSRNRVVFGPGDVINQRPRSRNVLIAETDLPPITTRVVDRVLQITSVDGGPLLLTVEGNRILAGGRHVLSFDTELVDKVLATGTEQADVIRILNAIGIDQVCFQGAGDGDVALGQDGNGVSYLRGEGGRFESTVNADGGQGGLVVSVTGNEVRIGNELVVTTREFVDFYTVFIRDGRLNATGLAALLVSSKGVDGTDTFLTGVQSSTVDLNENTGADTVSWNGIGSLGVTGADPEDIVHRSGAAPITLTKENGALVATVTATGEQVTLRNGVVQVGNLTFNPRSLIAFYNAVIANSSLQAENIPSLDVTAGGQNGNAIEAAHVGSLRANLAGSPGPDTVSVENTPTIVNGADVGDAAIDLTDGSGVFYAQSDQGGLRGEVFGAVDGKSITVSGNTVHIGPFTVSTQQVADLYTVYMQNGTLTVEDVQSLIVGAKDGGREDGGSAIYLTNVANALIDFFESGKGSDTLVTANSVASVRGAGIGDTAIKAENGAGVSVVGENGAPSYSIFAAVAGGETVSIDGTTVRIGDSLSLTTRDFVGSAIAFIRGTFSAKDFGRVDVGVKGGVGEENRIAFENVIDASVDLHEASANSDTVVATNSNVSVVGANAGDVALRGENGAGVGFARENGVLTSEIFAAVVGGEVVSVSGNTITIGNSLSVTPEEFLSSIVAYIRGTFSAQDFDGSIVVGAQGDAGNRIDAHNVDAVLADLYESPGPDEVSLVDVDDAQVVGAGPNDDVSIS